MKQLPDSWAAEIGAFADWMRASGRPASTVKLRLYQLRRFALGCGHEPGAASLESLVTWLAAPDWSADTRRSFRSALRAFYAWRQATGRAATNPAGLLPSISARPGVPRPADEMTVRRAVRLDDERVALMMRLGAFAGLRCCEIARVHSDDLMRDLVGWSLVVHGKGEKPRVVPVDDDTAELLRGRPRGWAFPGRVDGHLSAAYVSKLLSRHLPPGVTAHQLRHRFASAAYARGGRDILAVRDLLGHASVATTQVYTAMPADALRRGVLGAAAA